MKHRGKLPRFRFIAPLATFLASQTAGSSPFRALSSGTFSRCALNGVSSGNIGCSIKLIHSRGICMALRNNLIDNFSMRQIALVITDKGEECRL
ncbi:hypothetical protein BDV41DRAFT_551779 [Aspergillus transmontanensis]|uniref:Secreted protein n=1 Tax=Aspergillus transmontanensis TaxID=1034304 RepID=A0A5N6VJ32_9EURO|nr:hypothetical protein BDV41DRAFT_551779 [Aspergillus transmontanensis]